jgi:hypothetical protein
MQKYLLNFLLLFLSAGPLSAQALQHKPNQLFVSPEFSLGNAVIINQNNYGYSEMKYLLTPGWQAGALVGWDSYLQQSLKTGILVSKWGQHYRDVLLSGDRVEKDVNIYYVQIPATFKYVFGRKRGYDHEVFSPYVFGSVRLGYPFYADVRYYREDDSGILQEEDLVYFVTKGEWNLNTEVIRALGNPEKDRQLFSWLDVELEAGGGYQYFVTRLIGLFAEVHAVYGLLDINAGEWRLRDVNGKYSGSHNFYAGLKIGANFYLYKNKR